MTHSRSRCILSWNEHAFRTKRPKIRSPARLLAHFFSLIPKLPRSWMDVCECVFFLVYFCSVSRHVSDPICSISFWLEAYAQFMYIGYSYLITSFCTRIFCFFYPIYVYHTSLWRIPVRIRWTRCCVFFFWLLLRLFRDARGNWLRIALPLVRILECVCACVFLWWCPV